MVTLTLTDRGILTDGYQVYVEAQDWQGNLIGVEHEGMLDRMFAQKVLDVVTWFLEQVAAAATAFLSWLVEAIGPIAGLILGLMVGLAKSVVDAILGLPAGSGVARQAEFRPVRAGAPLWPKATPAPARPPAA